MKHWPKRNLFHRLPPSRVSFCHFSFFIVAHFFYLNRQVSARRPVAKVPLSQSQASISSKAAVSSNRQKRNSLSRKWLQDKGIGSDWILEDGDVSVSEHCGRKNMLVICAFSTNRQKKKKQQPNATSLVLVVCFFAVQTCIAHAGQLDRKVGEGAFGEVWSAALSPRRQLVSPRKQRSGTSPESPSFLRQRTVKKMQQLEKLFLTPPF